MPKTLSSNVQYSLAIMLRKYIFLYSLQIPHTLYWIPDKSHIRPHIPSRASTSLMRWPFPIPPNEGLQDISPTEKHEVWLRSMIGTCDLEHVVSLHVECSTILYS